MLSKKIILTGSFGVGKTSLFNRFISNTFSERYLTTIGVKVDKKTVYVNGEEVALILWDIAGEISQEKVPRTYFLGTSAIVYVYDLTRPSTQLNLKKDLALLEDILPGCIVKVVGNKKDITSPEKMEAAVNSKHTDLFTSAKTGENVEDLFVSLAKELLGHTNVG